MLKKYSMHVLTSQSEPYAMLKKTSERLEGNDKYEGLAVDLAQQIATIVGFNYTLSKMQIKYAFRCFFKKDA